MTRFPPRLDSIHIENFRSIKGAVDLRLDAPVVLIHGQNGAGKTSLLSAIELGLTKSVPSLATLDDKYRSHLVHKGAAQSCIEISAAGLTDDIETARVSIAGNKIQGSGLLSAEQAVFYSERCYLAQATLGKLLEIYQFSDARKSDSPLTKFVKDLLGLDQLENLIEGLHDARDVRRLRTKTPLYWEARDTHPKLDREIADLRQEKKLLEQEATDLGDRIRNALIAIGGEKEVSIKAEVVEDLLRGSVEELQLNVLARARRDISVLRQQWEQYEASQASKELEELEIRSQESDGEVERWRNTAGQKLEQEFTKLEKVFSNLPSPTSGRPEQARAIAESEIGEELSRCVELLEQHEEDTKSTESIDQVIRKATARVAALDKQLSDGAISAGDLAEGLAGLLPHIETNDCPVCDRDFSEVSNKDLGAHVTARIESLTESAARLGELARERAAAVTSIAESQRNRGVVAGRLLKAKDRDGLKTRRARLEESHRIIVELTSETVRGEQLLATAADQARQLNAARVQAKLANTIRDTLDRICNDAGLDLIGEKQTIETGLLRIEGEVAELEGKLAERQSLQRQARNDMHDLSALREKEETVQGRIDNEVQRRKNLSVAMARAEKRIDQAKELSKIAMDARTSVVRRVFNDSLNSVWRDLFVRLAPDEPFVPAFALPQSAGGPVEAVLETVHRSGGKGGNPQAMLSAGNLNTAALTLFIALHLSVEPVLPWLIVDDPVQSMDEVHIAQFAALLRTLSKQHGRQVIIAVHERALFDYLALELSPAFEGDRLITIELGRAADGATTHIYEPFGWKPDKAFAA